MTKQFKLGVSLATVGLIASIAVPTASISASEKTVTVGLVGSQDVKLWKSISKRAEKKYGFTIKTKVFSDYNQPNAAVAQGSIDLNAFQHYYFLNNWNKSNDNSVTAIGKTFLTPIRLYSNSHKKVTQFKDGDTISIPNDSTNEGRALILLQSAGLIKIKDGVDLPTTDDISENKLNLKIKAIAADQTPSSLKSADGAVINTNYAQEAKLKLSSAIYVEPINKQSKQWINVIVAKNSKKNDKTYKKVVKLYQSKQTKQYLKKTWGKAEVPAWDITLKQGILLGDEKQHGE